MCVCVMEYSLCFWNTVSKCMYLKCLMTLVNPVFVCIMKYSINLVEN